MTPDADLYLRWLEGRDEAAFAELARRHADLIADVAWRVGGDRHRAEDALQDSLLALARDRTARPASIGVRAWLARAAIGRARNLRASDAARSRREQAVARPEAATSAATTDLAGTVRVALSRLDGEDAAVLALRYLHGIDYAELAAILDVTEPTARVRVHRALERLRACAGVAILEEAGLAGAFASLPPLAAEGASVSAAVATALARGVAPRLAVLAGALIVTGGVIAWAAWDRTEDPYSAAPSEVARAPATAAPAPGLAVAPDRPAPPDDESRGVAPPALRTEGDDSAPKPPSPPPPVRSVSAPPPPRPVHVGLRMEVVAPGRAPEEVEIAEFAHKGNKWPGRVLREGQRLATLPGQVVHVSTQDPRAVVPGAYARVPDPVPSTIVVQVPARDDPRVVTLVVEVVDAATGAPLRDAALDDEDRAAETLRADEAGRIHIGPRAGAAETDVPGLARWYGMACTVHAPGHRAWGQRTRAWAPRKDVAAGEAPAEEMQAFLERGTIRVALAPIPDGLVQRRLRILTADGAPAAGALVAISHAWPEALGASARIDEATEGSRRVPADGEVIFPMATIVGIDVLRDDEPVAAYLLHRDGWPESGPRVLRLPPLADVEITIEGLPAGQDAWFGADALGAARTPADGPAFPVIRDTEAERSAKERSLVLMTGSREVNGGLPSTNPVIRFAMPVGTRKTLRVWFPVVRRQFDVEARVPGPLRLVRNWADLEEERGGSR